MCVRKIIQILNFLLICEFELVVVSVRIQGPLDEVRRELFGLIDDAFGITALFFDVNLWLLLRQICDTYEVLLLHHLFESLQVLNDVGIAKRGRVGAISHFETWEQRRLQIWINKHVLLE